MKRLFFDLWYRLARPPWDTGIVVPELRRVVEGEGLPAGRAIDLGCGTGTNAVYLAERGWEVVGVDFAESAIRAAQQKAAASGVADRATFVVGDVTRLPEQPKRFDLALDLGCFHSLGERDRTRYAVGLAGVLRAGGRYLLYAFTRRGLLAPAVPEAEVRELFSRWFDITDVETGTDRPSAWYFMTRRPV